MEIEREMEIESDGNRERWKYRVMEIERKMEIDSNGNREREREK